LIVSSDANLFTFSAAKWRGVIPNLFLALTLAEFWIRISAQPSDLNQIYSISQNDHHLNKVSTLRISQYVKQTLFSPNIIWPNIIWLDIILAKKKQVGQPSIRPNTKLAKEHVSQTSSQPNIMRA
jgi:hypothetical protein